MRARLHAEREQALHDLASDLGDDEIEDDEIEDGDDEIEDGDDDFVD